MISILYFLLCILSAHLNQGTKKKNVRNTQTNRQKPVFSAYNHEPSTTVNTREQADPSYSAKIRRGSYLSQLEGTPPLKNQDSKPGYEPGEDPS